MSKFFPHVVAVVSIVAVSVVAYLPAVDNTFISDDFGLFPLLKALEQNPSYIFDATSEFFRVMSYVYFFICYKIFGITPEPFYWAGIVLHTIVSLLVYLLTLNMTKSTPAALAAGVFFAAYERHQEAVMWISAANETVLTLNCLLFLLLWQHSIAGPTVNRISRALSLFVLTLALFSKEAAVVLIPLAALSLMLKGYSVRETLRQSLPLFVMLLAFVTLWLWQADRNFFVTDGHYEFGLHFIPVYARTLSRLVAPIIPFALAWFVTRRQWKEFPLKTSLVFFAALLVSAIAPYTFLTYLDHLPSRNTYFPSVGLAGVVGILFAASYTYMSSERSRRAVASLLIAVVGGNAVYIWLKKEPQYRERAAPTRELITVLNSGEIRDVHLPIYVCGFPLHPWVFSETIKGFTPLKNEDVVLLESCPGEETAPLLRWDQETASYSAKLQ